MTRERVGSVILRAYPREVRLTRGAEMLGTLLDASEGSSRLFIRDGLSLVLAGLGERTMVNGRAGTRRLIADGCAQAAVIWMSLFLIWATPGVAPLGRHFDALGFPELRFMALWVVLAFALIRFDRIAGLCGVAWFAVLIPDDLGLLERSSGVLNPVSYLVPLLCFTVMIFAPRIRACDARRLLWLIPVAGLAVLPETENLGTVVFPAAISLAALVLLPVDPRLAIASALLWTGTGVTIAAVDRFAHTSGNTWLVIVFAPLMILIASTRLQVVRRRIRT